MFSITAVLASRESGLRIRLQPLGGSQIRTRTKDFAGRSAVFPTLSKGLEIALTDFKAENAMVQVDYLRQVVEVVIDGVPIVLEVLLSCCSCLSAEYCCKVQYQRICSTK